MINYFLMIKLRGKHKTELAIICWVVAGLTIVYFFVLAKLPFFAVAKLKTQDIILALSRPLRPPPLNSGNIVIISIDDESFSALNKKWPWRRAMFAYLIDRLKLYQPKVIALDFSFTGESEQKTDDELLSQAIAYADKKVVLASYISPQGEYMAPWKKLTDSIFAYGFVNKPQDRDFYVRNARTAIFSAKGGIIDYSLELKILAKYLGSAEEDIAYQGENIRIKDTLIPIDKDGTLPINFRFELNEFNRLPFWQVLNVELASQAFKDKIVLVGSTSEIVHDIYHTPLGIMPGVAINANTLLMLLNKDFIKTAPSWLEFLIMLCLVMFVLMLTYKTARPQILILIAGLITIYCGIGVVLFMRNIRLDYFGPVFMMAACHLGVSAYKYFKLTWENINLKTLAITDGLTGLFTYRYFELRLNSELERAKRYGLTFSLAIMDIDHFKKVNDTYGHEAGNAVLRQITELLRKESRKVDILFRYGGEEFCVILTHTSKQGALRYTEKMRKLIENSKFPETKESKVTSSFGIASFPEVNAPTIKELINAADIALYKAKNSGRNCSIVFKPEFLSEKTLNKNL